MTDPLPTGNWPAPAGTVPADWPLLPGYEILEELGRGLAKEVAVWRKGNDPLLYLERKAYLQAIREAISGVEAARVVLVKACQRIEAEGRSREAGEAA